MRYPVLSITIGVLEAMFNNASLCSEFPFVAFAKKSWNGAAPARGGCKKCGNRPSREARQHLLETVKAHILSLPPERLDRLKAILNTDKIVMTFIVRGVAATKEL